MNGTGRYDALAGRTGLAQVRPLYYYHYHYYYYHYEYGQWTDASERSIGPAVRAVRPGAPAAGPGGGPAGTSPPILLLSIIIVHYYAGRLTDAVIDDDDDDCSSCGAPTRARHQVRPPILLLWASPFGQLTDAINRYNRLIEPQAPTRAAATPTATTATPSRRSSSRACGT